NKIPNEILDNIISLATCQGQLDAIYDLSRASGRQPSSPQRGAPDPTARYCVAVSHRWQGIGTPLLYSTIVIRSNAQALALVETLEAFPDVRPLVKRLFVLDGYGKPMKSILKLTSRLESIALTLNVPAKASITGLLNGLPLINPRQLVVHDHPDYAHMVGP
ncbi:hypothetical protein C8R47DRAFT_917563, partial [Mycena vitilis]